MANTTKRCPKGEWTQLTEADVTEITFVNNGGAPILVKGTVGAVAPTDDLGAILYDARTGEVNMTIADVWLGVVGVNRLYAKAFDTVDVMVSHA